VLLQIVAEYFVVDLALHLTFGQLRAQGGITVPAQTTSHGLDTVRGFDIRQQNDEFSLDSVDIGEETGTPS